LNCIAQKRQRHNNASDAEYSADIDMVEGSGTIGVRAGDWVGAAAHPRASESGKAVIFRANATFFGQKPGVKKEKDIFWYLYLFNEKKRNSFRPAR